MIAEKTGKTRIQPGGSPAAETKEASPANKKLLPRQLAERHHIVPVFSSGEEVTIATYDPTRIDLFDWLAKELHRQVITVIASRMEIERAIARLYKIRGFELLPLEQPPENVSEVAALETAPMVDQIVSKALELQASAIHVEAAARNTLVRYRVDGVLRNVGTLPSELHLAVVSRLKTMAQLNPTERQLPQDGRSE